MKLSLHSVILGGGLSFEDQLKLAADLRYQGIDDGFGMAAQQGPAAFNDMCAKYGVFPACWGPGVEYRQDEVTFNEGMKGLAEQAKLAAAIHCPRACTWIPPAVDEDGQGTLKVWAKRWGEMAKVLGDYGHRFGLEFVGPEHIRRGKSVTLYRMDQLLDLESDIGEPNLGLLLDSFHWFNAEHTYDDLVKVPAEKIVHVHLNDAPDVSLADQQDFERLTPGEGIIDLVGFLQALKDIGYQDYMGVEIFSKELAAMPPAESAKRVKDGCDKLLAQVK
jgi:sugar phosphate isomerase/epimerase